MSILALRARRLARAGEIGLQAIHMTQKSLRILYLINDIRDVAALRTQLVQAAIDAEVTAVATFDAYISALGRVPFDAVLCTSVPKDCDCFSALQSARQCLPHALVILLYESAPDRILSDSAARAGAQGVAKTALHQLAALLQRLSPTASRPVDTLIAVVQQLSLARDLPTIMDIVRHAARQLTGADGASFVLRDGDLCYYADEDAIAPLWKGRRFPIAACISGWAMLNRQSVVIEDIYADPRVPADAYRPTFIKSLAMVPIRSAAPVGAIGNYWARPHRASAAEMQLLQALANSTAIAMENVQLYQELEQRVAERTAQLQAANQELEAFSYSVSHDLRAPLRAIDGFSGLLLERSDSNLDAESQAHLQRIRRAATHMGNLIESLLKLARITRAEISRSRVDLSALAQDIVAELQAAEPQRAIEIDIATGMAVEGDRELLRVALENLLANAWKYTARQSPARVSFGCRNDAAQATPFYFVRDNGAGFDMNYAGKLFGAFQRLHSDQEFPGLGVGLATVQRIVHKHAGRIWAEAKPGDGATFYFTLT